MRRITAALLLCLFPLATLPADIADVAKKVQQAEAVPDERRPVEIEDDSEADDGDGSFAEFVFGVFGLVWLWNNLGTTYGPYPHAPEGYVLWQDAEGESPPGGRDQRYSTDAQAFELKGFGRGAWARLEGRFFRFIGPYAEVWTLDDGHAVQYSSRLGGQVSLFNADGFNWFLYGQYVHWFGAIERDGSGFGSVMRSYPVKPLSLEWRAGVQTFDGFVVGASEVSIGALIGRFEPYVGYRWWNLGTGGDSSVDIGAWSGAFAGLRAHF